MKKLIPAKGEKSGCADVYVSGINNIEASNSLMIPDLLGASWVSFLKFIGLPMMCMIFIIGSSTHVQAQSSATAIGSKVNQLSEAYHLNSDASSANVGIFLTSGDLSIGSPTSAKTWALWHNAFNGGSRLQFRRHSGSTSSSLQSKFHSSTPYMTILDNGYVGIGASKTNPSYHLDIEGDVNVDATIISGGDITSDGEIMSVDRMRAYNLSIGSSEYTEIGHGGGNGYINTKGDGNLDFRHDGNTLMSLTDAGGLGIGTDTPDATLHIQSDNAAGQLLVEPNSDNGEDAIIKIRGHRNSTTSAKQSRLIFQNYDHDLSVSNSIGMITGEVTNAGINVGDMVFYTYANGATETEAMRLTGEGHAEFSGNATISGTTNLREANAAEFNVRPDMATDFSWPDYVFQKQYQLRPLAEVGQFIAKNSHLPDVLSAKEVSASGYNMAEMDATLLKKIEELTLYMLDLKKENEGLKARLDHLTEKK